MLGRCEYMRPHRSVEVDRLTVKMSDSLVIEVVGKGSENLHFDVLVLVVRVERSQSALRVLR